MIKEESMDLKTRWKMTIMITKFEKEFHYVFGSSQMFFMSNLNLNNASSFKVRAINYFSMLKSLVFSVLINSLQIMPKGQVTLILLI